MRFPDPNSQKGEFILYTGPMNCGKTEALVKHTSNLIKHASQNIQAFSVLENTRDGLDQIVGENGDRLNAISIPMNNPEKILEYVHELIKKHRLDGVSIDEINLFNYMIIPTVNSLRALNLLVQASGLDKSFRGEPFGVMPYLKEMVNPRSLESTTFNSYCKLIKDGMQCCNPATYTARLSRESDSKVSFLSKDNKIIEGYGFAPYFDPLKFIEEKGNGIKQREYTAACGSCFKIPLKQETLEVYNSLISGVNSHDIKSKYSNNIIHMLLEEDKIKSDGKGFYSAREHVFDMNSGIFVPKHS